MFPPFSGYLGTQGADEQIPLCCYGSNSFSYTFLAFFLYWTAQWGATGSQMERD